MYIHISISLSPSLFALALSCSLVLSLSQNLAHSLSLWIYIYIYIQLSWELLIFLSLALSISLWHVFIISQSLLGLIFFSCLSLTDSLYLFFVPLSLLISLLPLSLSLKQTQKHMYTWMNLQMSKQTNTHAYITLHCTTFHYITCPYMSLHVLTCHSIHPSICSFVRSLVRSFILDCFLGGLSFVFSFPLSSVTFLRSDANAPSSHFCTNFARPDATGKLSAKLSF